MNDFIYETIVSLKYLGIGILMIFFSGEAVMPFVGYKASQGSLDLLTAIAAGALGSTFGSTVVYAVVRHLNRDKVAHLLTKYGRWFGITERKINRAGKLFDQHARQTVFFGRFIPGVRTAVSVPAGYQHMPVRQFVLYTFLGSVASAAVLGLMGYYLRVGFNRVESFATIFTYVVAAVAIIFILYIVVKKRRFLRVK